MNSKNTGDVKAKADMKALLKEARLPERSVMVCFDQSLTADMEQLERELAEANKRPEAASLGGDPRVEIAERMQAVHELALTRSREFRFRALPRRAYTALLKAHPPRKDDDIDRVNGFNVDEFFDVLIRTCLAEPALDDEDWTVLLGRDADPDDPDDEGVDGVLSSAQYDTIANTAWGVNRRDVDVPFSLNASRILGTSSAE